MSLRQCTPPPYLPAFTRRPGTKIYLAGSSNVICVYPTALRIYTCHFDELELQKEVLFPEIGPVVGWTAYVDSMRQVIQIEGKGRLGFVRYRIHTTEDGVSLTPSSGMMKISMHGVVSEVAKCDDYILAEERCILPRFPTPRLLLGCNKAPNWDRIMDHPTMEEVLPFWYTLASPNAEASFEPSSSLFGSIVEAINKHKTLEILSAFETFFRVAIDGFFAPKRIDDRFFGYPFPILPDEISLSAVHPSICTMIRSLFLQESGNIIDILPCLPKELVSGRLLHETLTSGHRIDIEWRKSGVRRILLHATKDGAITIKAQAATATLRPIQSKARKRVVKIGDTIEVEEGKSYLLDNFLR